MVKCVNLEETYIRMDNTNMEVHARSYWSFHCTSPCKYDCSTQDLSYTQMYPKLHKAILTLQTWPIFPEDWRREYMLSWILYFLQGNSAKLLTTKINLNNVIVIKYNKAVAYSKILILFSSKAFFSFSSCMHKK